MSKVSPYNKDNAIKSAAFALEFDKEMSEDILQTIRKLYEEDTDFKSEFPQEELLQTVKMQMGPNVQELSTSQLGGLSYIKQSTAHFDWRLLIQGNSISITCNAYTRWDTVWEFTRRYFAKILSLLDGFALNKIILEYLDEFSVNDLTNNTWLNELFKNDSPYLPKFVYDMQEPWHSHNGFITKKENQQIINLINMNLVLNNVGIGTLMIQTQHSSSLSTKVLLNTKDNGLDSIETVMKDNHEFNKELLNKHLSQTVLDEIGLKVD